MFGSVPPVFMRKIILFNVREDMDKPKSNISNERNMNPGPKRLFLKWLQEGKKSHLGWWMFMVELWDEYIYIYIMDTESECNQCQIWSIAFANVCMQRPVRSSLQTWQGQTLKVYSQFKVRAHDFSHDAAAAESDYCTVQLHATHHNHMHVFPIISSCFSLKAMTKHCHCFSFFFFMGMHEIQITFAFRT